MRTFTLLAVPIALALSGCGSNESAEPAAEADATNPAATETVETDSSAAAPAPEVNESPNAETPPVAAAAPRIPRFNATCGDGIEVHAGRGGPVFIGGKEASLKKFNDNYFEATLDQITVSISVNADESISLSYSGPNRAHGICTLS